MTIEKKSKVNSLIIENSDLSTLSFSKFFSSLIQTKYSTLTKIREHYNPSNYWKKFQEDYNHNTFFENCTNLVYLISNSLVYSFLPAWLFRAILETLFSSVFWQFTITKTEILIENHRLSVRTSVNTRPVNFTTILSIFPFVIGFFYFLTKKYPIELNQYFFVKNLPGLSRPSEKLNWDTVHYLLKPSLKKENLKSSTVQSIYQENSLVLNTNIFEDYLGQKIFINNYKKRSSQIGNLVTGLNIPINSVINQDHFTLRSVFSGKKSTGSYFQNLDELPAYLESFSAIKNFSNAPLLNIKNSKSLDRNQNTFSTTKYSTTRNKNHSIKHLSQNLFQSKNNNDLKILNTNSQNSNILLGLKISKKPEFLSKSLDSSLKNNFLNNKFLLFQSEFQGLWDLLQSELRTLFLTKNVLLAQKENKASNQFSQEIDSTIFSNLKKLSVIEEKGLLEEILSYLDEKEIIENSFETRRMSGYRYPDMTTVEINRLFLQQKLTPLRFNFPTLPNFSKWSLQSPEPGKAFLEIKIPSSFVETNIYNLNFESFPNFSIFTKPLILKDLQTDKVLYEGPGIVLDTNTGLDWKTEIRNTNFQFEKVNTILKKQGNQNVLDDLLQSNKLNLRLWFHKYIAPYPGFTNSTKNFFGTQVSQIKNVGETITSPKANWIRNFPLYTIQPQDQNNPDSLPRLTNLNESFFDLKTQLHVPFVSPLDWTQYYQKVTKRKTQLKDLKQLDCFPIPILQIRVPRIQEKNSPLQQVTSQISLYDNIDYKFDNTGMNLGTSNSFFLNTETSLETILENENFGNVLSGGTYKKLPTSFLSLSSSKNFFQENWEPLTSHSWLIVSQLGFAFSVFQILKTLADNYGRELLVYLLDLVAAVGVMDPELKQEIEILMGQREKGFRIISTSRKKFSDIAGVKNLLPKVAEIVWFLRNSAREFSISKTLPRGILLIGPPGTGKTLLVQALAGEAHVPVLALSGSSLVEPGESGALKLEILFQEARRLAPCIVFIDEIDTLAQKREKVMQNPMATEGTDAVLDVLTNPPNSGIDSSQFGKFRISLTTGRDQTDESEISIDPFSSSNSSSALETQVTQQVQEQQDLQKEQLSLLMQFLIELDGIKTREGVIVIGATNRPEMLDPAVLRPGRFDRVLKLGLPGYEKRIEILKLYSQKLGYDDSISWNYFAERTVGFAAADLASLMNQSSLRAILTDTHHTVETIEHGIDRITTLEGQYAATSFSSTKKSTKIKSFLKETKVNSLEATKNSVFTESNSKKALFENVLLSKPRIFESNRFAYYQAGKIICTSLLEHHPPILVAHLWPRRPNLRSLKIAQNLQNYFFKFARRNELEDRIIGCYSGKVGEILFLQKVSAFESMSTINQLFNINLSTIGLEDLSFGQVLVKFLIENWYLYSTESLSYKMTELSDNRNRQELSEEKIALMNHLCQDLESTPRPIGQFLPSPFKSSEKDQASGNENRNLVAQHNFSIPWWQKQISAEFDVAERNFFDWYRIYMSNPEETELNPEWSPPDEFYHRNKNQEAINFSTNKSKLDFEIPNLTFNQQRFVMGWWQTDSSSDCSWNDLTSITQDYQTHSLVLQSFNKALLLIDEHRELLDAIAGKLLTQKVLRQWDIVSIFENYNFASSQLDVMQSKDQSHETNFSLNFPRFTSNKKCVVSSAWGQSSRRKTANWIDFDSVVTQKN